MEREQIKQIYKRVFEVALLYFCVNTSLKVGEEEVTSVNLEDLADKIYNQQEDIDADLLKDALFDLEKEQFFMRKAMYGGVYQIQYIAPEFDKETLLVIEFIHVKYKKIDKATTHE